MRKRLGVLLFVLLVVIAAAPSHGQSCGKCMYWCPPEWWLPCEWTCEQVSGYCPNCYEDCAAYLDYCRVTIPCYWAGLPTGTPTLRISQMPGGGFTDSSVGAVCSPGEGFL
jgi:hypothetical protein